MLLTDFFEQVDGTAIHAIQCVEHDMDTHIFLKHNNHKNDMGKQIMKGCSHFERKHKFRVSSSRTCCFYTWRERERERKRDKERETRQRIAFVLKFEIYVLHGIK